MKIYDANEGWIRGGSEIRYSFVYYDNNKEITGSNPRGNGYFLAEWKRDEIMLMRWSLREGRCIKKHDGDYTKTLDDARPYLNKDWQPADYDFVAILIYEKDVLGSKKVIPHDASPYTSEAYKMKFTSNEDAYGVWQLNTDTAAFSRINPKDLLQFVERN